VAGQREAARGDQLEGRRRKTDFALWRADDPDQRRIMRWESPWGSGVPGWHLECSVMSIALLGEHFDVHTGGVDHRELHHVNEIAQSEAYLSDGLPWVRYWLHGEFLQLGGQKMAKSAGGAPRLADLTEAGYHPMAFRLFLLGSHYRSQVEFTPAAMDTAQATLRRLVTRIAPLRTPAPGPAPWAIAGLTSLERANCAIDSGAEPDPTAARVLAEIDAAPDPHRARPPRRPGHRHSRRPRLAAPLAALPPARPRDDADAAPAVRTHRTKRTTVVETARIALMAVRVPGPPCAQSSRPAPGPHPAAPAATAATPHGQPHRPGTPAAAPASRDTAEVNPPGQTTAPPPNNRVAASYPALNSHNHRGGPQLLPFYAAFAERADEPL
jgi:hypothetical protein